MPVAPELPAFTHTWAESPGTCQVDVGDSSAANRAQVALDQPTTTAGTSGQ